MRNLHLSLVAIFVSISLIILGGCLGKGTQEPTRLYMLQPLASSETNTEAGAVDDAFSLRVGPIRLPEYLNRPQIVTRTEENKIQLGVFHHWGEPLERNFASVLALNMSNLLSTTNIILHPWAKKEDVKYILAVDVIRFDGEFNGNATLHARWYLTHWEDDNPKVLATRISRYTETVGGESYENLVVAESRALEAFSREIAEVIKGLPQEGAGQ
ncbi:MAG: membrane integrity-associated transporter subunit PqiC [Deltaproteobacteria bacterium]|nr:MAG: membrane integrity-associated transporter subunit PqiC [Deltaproteobacteria bacterium]